MDKINSSMKNEVKSYMRRQFSLLKWKTNGNYSVVIYSLLHTLGWHKPVSWDKISECLVVPSRMSLSKAYVILFVLVNQECVIDSRELNCRKHLTMDGD